MARTKDYDDVTGTRKRSILPPDVQLGLKRLAADLPVNKVPVSEITRLLDGLSLVPAAAIVTAAQDMMIYGELFAHHQYDKWGFSDGGVFVRRMVQLMEQTPGLEFILMFHGNGYLRQAALQLTGKAVASTFQIAAVMYRLNDWVPQVRREAFGSVLRLLAETPAALVAAAVSDILALRLQWQRGASELVIVDEALSRPDVFAVVMERLMTVATGGIFRSLQALMRDDRIDAVLPDLARRAAHPAIRGLALTTLISGQAKSRIGFEKRWIDRSMNRYRRVPVFDARPVSTSLAPEALIRQGAEDHSASVRKVAMQALIDRPELWSSHADTIDRLGKDRSAAIRAGIAYIRRQQTPPSY